MRSMIVGLSLLFGTLSLAAACGDDDDEKDDVTIDTPGVDVDVEKQSVAGSSATRN